MGVPSQQLAAYPMHDVDAERLEQTPDNDERQHPERGIAEKLRGRHACLRPIAPVPESYEKFEYWHPCLRCDVFRWIRARFIDARAQLTGAALSPPVRAAADAAAEIVRQRIEDHGFAIQPRDADLLEQNWWVRSCS